MLKRVQSLRADEFLFLIFFTAMERAWTSDWFSVAGPRSVPIAVSQVCYRWRVIALDRMPSLWSRLHISFPLRPNLFELWHRNAFGCPIDFRLTIRLKDFMCRSHSGGKAVEGYQRFRDFFNKFLARNLTRYRTIFIQIRAEEREHESRRFSELVLRQFEKYQQSLTLVEGFFFETGDDNRSIPPQQVPPTITIFPKGAASLVAVRIEYPCLLPFPVCARLRRLEISVSRYSPRDVHFLIDHCLALNTLVIDGSFAPKDNYLSDLEGLPHFYLPHLSTLEFGSGYTPHLFKFLYLFSNTPCQHIIFRRFWWRETNCGISRSDIGSFSALEALSFRFFNTEKVHNQRAAICALYDCFPQVRSLNVDALHLDLFVHLEYGDLWSWRRYSKRLWRVLLFLIGPIVSYYANNLRDLVVNRWNHRRLGFRNLGRDGLASWEGLKGVVEANNVDWEWPRASKNMQDWEE